jgi:hypothetical protein
MREKLLWSIVVLLGLMLIASHAQTPARSESPIGRYQIVTIAGNAAQDAQAFKIDTATGKTWHNVTVGKLGWAVMVDYPETAK